MDSNGNYQITDEKLATIESCSALESQLLTQQETILKELNLSNEESSIFKALEESRHVQETGENLVERCKHVLEKINSGKCNNQRMYDEISEYYRTLQILQTTYQYLRVIRRLVDLDEELKQEFLTNRQDDEHCTTIYANLCEISRNLRFLHGTHLRQLLNSILHDWHNVLKEKFEMDLDSVLKVLKWPYVYGNKVHMPLAPPVAILHKLQMIFEYLIQIELPLECDGNDNECLPVILLAKPLRKRFLYHFYGGRQTNRLDKPEWYFTQILSWIRDHTDVVTKWLQPIVDKMGQHHIDVRLTFTNCLVDLAVDKLTSDLPNSQTDDYTFSHMIDEALAFDKELRDCYQYPCGQNGVLGVLTQGQIFVKWLAMEQKYATEKMDNMLADTKVAFAPLTNDMDDMLKVTFCADAFIALLQTITERYTSLPQPGHRLQFLELQLHLLDDFRIRLLQLVHEVAATTTFITNLLDGAVPHILNTVHYIEMAILDWSTMLHYLNLQFYKQQMSSTSDSSGIFDEILALYRRLKDDLLATLADCVVYNVKQSAKSYRRHVMWSRFKSSSTRDIKMTSLSLTPEACPMLEVLSRDLHTLRKHLMTSSGATFEAIWKCVAQQLDTFLFEDVVLENRFSDGGALQIKYDISRNLLPLFGQFCQQPHLYFPQTLSAICLLNTAKGTALLLRDTLKALDGASGIEDTRTCMLRDVGVGPHCTPLMALKILNQRTDITVNRIEYVD